MLKASGRKDKSSAQKKQTSAYVNIEEEEKNALKQDTMFIMDLGDGITVVKLLSSKALSKEAEYMHLSIYGHDRVENGSKQVYSIRDKDGLPHVTIEVKAGEVIDCKGKYNRSISKNIYLPYVQKFVIEQKINPSQLMGKMNLCVDKHGNFYDIDNIPEKTEFDYLNVSGRTFGELPASLFTCKVNKEFHCSTNRVCRDTQGRIHDFFNLPEGIEFNHLDVSRLDITEFPAALATCTVKGDFSCYHNKITSFKNSPEVKGRIIAFHNKYLNSLAGMKEGVKEVDLSYCPSLPAITGIPEGVEDVGVDKCPLLPSIKDLPQSVKFLSCDDCTFTSLEGISPRIKKIYCSKAIKVIPDFVPYEAMVHFDKKDFELGKARWRVKHNLATTKDKTRVFIADRGQKTYTR